MERRNIFVNFPYIDSFKIQTLASIFMFEQFMNNRNDILLPSISNMTPAYKYLKYNLGFKSTQVFILKPIQ
jgi:hypothetical protein